MANNSKKNETDKVEVSAEQQALVESELRRGTSKSRIATLLEMPYEDATKVIDQVKESVRPEVGEEVKFYFRDSVIVGRIEKLLTNSGVVKIYWEYSDLSVKEILGERTVVNFKDIDQFLHIYDGEGNPEKSLYDAGLTLNEGYEGPDPANYQPTPEELAEHKAALEEAEEASEEEE